MKKEHWLIENDRWRNKLYWLAAEHWFNEYHSESEWICMGEQLLAQMWGLT